MEAHDLSAENPRGDLHRWLDELLDSAEAQGYSGEILLTAHLKTGRLISAERQTRERRTFRRAS